MFRFFPQDHCSCESDQPYCPARSRLVPLDVSRCRPGDYPPEEPGYHCPFVELVLDSRVRDRQLYRLWDQLHRFIMGLEDSLPDAGSHGSLREPYLSLPRCSLPLLNRVARHLDPHRRPIHARDPAFLDVGRSRGGSDGLPRQVSWKRQPRR